MGKKVSKNGKGSYASYKAMNSFAKNKEKSIKRHIKANPDDEAAKAALAKVGSAKPRKEPVRMKARIDSWVLPNAKGEYVTARTRNMMSGRLSPWGKFTQEGERLSKALYNRLLNDPRRVTVPNKEMVNPQEVWAGWNEFIANGGKMAHEIKNQKPNRNNKKNKRPEKAAA